MELAGNQKFREIVGARENEGMFSLAKRLKDRDAWKGVAEKMVKALKKTDDEVGHMTLYIVSQGGGPRKQVILREMCLYEEALSEFANMEGKK
jgi:hypothetical protein